VLSLAALAVVRFGLTLSIGPEYDSNANRAEIVHGDTMAPDSPTGSFLIRSTGTLRFAWKTDYNVLRLSIGGGGKLYFNPDVFDQDVFALSLSGEERVRVARFMNLAFVGDYYDAFQLPVAPFRARDFRSGSAVGRVYLLDRLGEVALSGGYRGFQYKPDPYFNFEAGQATAYAVARLNFGANDDHELDVAASYHVERRFFPGVIEMIDQSRLECLPGRPFQDTCLVAGTTKRSDWWHEGGFELTYVGPVLVGVGYGLQLNLSNSFGQSLLRQLVTLKLAYRFPWQLYATLKAQLFVTRYLDPVLLDTNIATQTFITIDDENRNAVIVDLERPLGGSGLALNARYSVFTNELTASPVSFLRQVVYLGLTYRVGAR
jgi:hypothetical protein